MAGLNIWAPGSGWSCTPGLRNREGRSWYGGDREGGLETAPRTASRSQEEQHRSHENCLDAASDDLLDLQRNLPERRGRSRELEDYRLRKEYLEYEVRSLSHPPPGPSAALSWPWLSLQPWLPAAQGSGAGEGLCENSSPV